MRGALALVCVVACQGSSTSNEVAALGSRLLRAGPSFDHAPAVGDATSRAIAYVQRLAPRTLARLDGLGEVPALGGTIVRLQQTIDGVPIDRGELRVLMRSTGELVAVSGTSIDADTPRISTVALDAHAAIARAERIDPITHAHAVRVWYGDRSGLVAAWRVDGYAWRTILAADDGRVLEHLSLVQHDGYDYRVFADSTGNFRPGAPVANFFPHPTDMPDGSVPPPIGPALVHVSSLNHLADPWLPPNSTETVGNNTDTYVDLYMPEGLSPGDFRASTTAPGVFDRTYDPAQSPLASQDQQMAVITQLFFIVNWLHDFWYDAGFVETAGNAQMSNYGRGGLEGDPLIAEAQDGGGAKMNNAQLVIMPDGISPRLSVFLWSAPDQRSIASGAQIDETNVANFGPTAFDASGSLVVAADACSALGPVAGQIVLVSASTCTAKTQVLNAQAAGAAGVIVADSAFAWTAPRLADDPTITTPITIGALAITQSEGAALAAASGTVTLHRAQGPLLDGSLDIQLVAHEFGHYLHQRLSPGCGNPACLSMSEGWGDFDALMTTVRAGDDLHGAYPMFAYSAQAWTGDGFYFGLRRVAYSVNPALDALTFRNMRSAEPFPTTQPFVPNAADNSELHNAGEVWCTALWEAYVALQEAGTSFDAVHQKVARYVVAGLAMVPPDATPTETRDALIAAADANSHDDATVLAAAFARRGFGSCAQSAPRLSMHFNEIVESRTVNGVLGVGAVTVTDDVTSCDSDGILDAGETGTVSITLSNSGFAPLANVSVTLVPMTSGLSSASAPVSIASLAPYASTTATFEVSLADPTASDVMFSLQIATPDGCTAMTVVPQDMRVNVDDVPASSAVDHFDTGVQAWLPQMVTLPGTTWTHERRTATDGYWHAAAPEAAADSALVSPPMTADATAPVTIGFTHRYGFAPSQGAVLEYSVDGGATWADVSTLGSVGYNGTIRNYGSALDGRPGFIDANDSYPSSTTVTIDLGTQLAGQTFQVRFRFASSAYDFRSDPPPGWDVDDFTTTGVGTPFPSVVPDDGECTPGPGPKPKHSGGCCDAGAAPPVSAVLVLVVLRRRRRR
jgi:hypothetical protein